MILLARQKEYHSHNESRANIRVSADTWSYLERMSDSNEFMLVQSLKLFVVAKQVQRGQVIPIRSRVHDIHVWVAIATTWRRF